MFMDSWLKLKIYILMTEYFFFFSFFFWHGMNSLIAIHELGAGVNLTRANRALHQFPCLAFELPVEFYWNSFVFRWKFCSRFLFSSKPNRKLIFWKMNLQTNLWETGNLDQIACDTSIVSSLRSTRASTM